MAKIYEQIAGELRRRMQTGAYAPGDAIPSERALEEEFESHRTTVRRAVNLLVKEGSVVRARGHRAFVRQAPSISAATIGLYAGDYDDPYSRSIFAEGVQSVIEDRYRNLSSLAAPSPELFRGSADANLAGVILLPPHPCSLSDLRQIKKRIPVTILDQMVPGFESDFVGFQDFEAGYAAARHLYEVGHRKIAFLGSILPETAHQRLLGVDAFCKDAGIERTWNFCAFQAGRQVPEGYVEALFKLAKDSWPSAAVCTNDETAAFMISLLGRMGIRVPADLGLIGFGNAQTKLLEALGLSTMAQPYREVGREAMILTAERMSGRSGDPAEIRLPMQLVVRTSCGATRPNVAA
jgi:DNA-binding LacI/PurR family transcriptional regulator